MTQFLFHSFIYLLFIYLLLYPGWGIFFPRHELSYFYFPTGYNPTPLASWSRAGHHVGPVPRAENPEAPPRQAPAEARGRPPGSPRAQPVPDTCRPAALRPPSRADLRSLCAPSTDKWVQVLIGPLCQWEQPACTRVGRDGPRAVPRGGSDRGDRETWQGGRRGRRARSGHRGAGPPPTVAMRTTPFLFSNFDYLCILSSRLPSR